MKSPAKTTSEVQLSVDAKLPEV